jgi:hypothetical protein
MDLPPLRSRPREKRGRIRRHDTDSPSSFYPHLERITRMQCLPRPSSASQLILWSGFGGRKAPSSMGKISKAEVLRLRARTLC